MLSVDNQRAKRRRLQAEAPREYKIRQMLKKARQRANAAGMPFAIDRDDVAAVWPPDDRCPVFGRAFVDGRKRRTQAAQFSPSLDRLDSRIGYLPGNIAVISMRANMLKNDVRNPAELRRLADWLEGQHRKISLFS
jgi:hypothetical protein